MFLSDFDYPLDPARIAQSPLPHRDDSRLMILHRAPERIEHTRFSDICDHLRPEDVLVLNDTRVIPARLLGRKVPTGGAVEVLLTRRYEDDLWGAIVGGRVRKGTRICFDEACFGEVVEEGENQKILRLEYTGSWSELLDRLGSVPLPPYIERVPVAEDRERYQTVYSRREGAVAAPTAGLHFTNGLLNRLKEKGISLAFVTLHVGPGTFRPVRETVIEKHDMDPEGYEIGEEAVAVIRKAREAGGRIVAVGTTTVRVLETVAGDNGQLRPARGESRLFIYPGFPFRWVDALVTNFHLPRSTLLMLVSAFAGRDRAMGAYAEAAALDYRFYSYGDAMMIF